MYISRCQTKHSSNMNKFVLNFMTEDGFKCPNTQKPNRLATLTTATRGRGGGDQGGVANAGSFSINKTILYQSCVFEWKKTDPLTTLSLKTKQANMIYQPYQLTPMMTPRFGFNSHHGRQNNNLELHPRP